MGQYEPIHFARVLTFLLSTTHWTPSNLFLRVLLLECNRNETMNTRVWSPIPVIKEAISVYLSVHPSAKSVFFRYPRYEGIHVPAVVCYIGPVVVIVHGVDAQQGGMENTGQTV